jgi:WD40 repeat protein/serine/threonine protein kinase
MTTRDDDRGPDGVAPEGPAPSGDGTDRPVPPTAGTTLPMPPLEPGDPAWFGKPPGKPPSDPASSDSRGDFVGPYKLLAVIGEGGFGTVYLAERREPIVQRVALKIIKLGMDTRAVIARFEQERQALAVMDHPNVAKVFDAGATPAGRPYFVMEHVSGEPITDYADRHNLTIRQRLELFIPVCEAIQHAHHKGIIHRDVKPSNILVTVRDNNPVPKIIDFGVAKAISHTLTEKTIFTEQGQLIGTPEYMSPEQAEMGATDIDTRTDVYSLGVVLYELLSGMLPFDSDSLRAAGYAAIIKVLREQDAPKPSTRLSTADDATGADIARHRVVEREHLARELKRELDWIPLKALRKDRTKRYDTPADLAKDIQRYLDGEPLEAGPEATSYRVKKFIRRNKGPVIAVGGVVVALLLGLAGTITQAQRANANAREEVQARALADQRTAEAEAERLKADAERAKAVALVETIEHNSYVANLEMAAAAMEMRSFDRVRQRLDACSERVRGWEWGWMNAGTDNSLMVLRTPSGRRRFPTAHVRIGLAGNDVTASPKRSRGLNAATFSTDGKRIGVVWPDGTAQMWEAPTGVTLAELTEHTPDEPVISGARLLTRSDRWRYVESAAFSPDGGRIVMASMDSMRSEDGTDSEVRTVRVWDAAMGASVAELKGHTDEVLSADFSPDGTRIVTASKDGTSRVWDAATGANLAELKGHTGSVASATFSPDGTRIVTASDDGTARVWDVATGASLAELKGHTYAVFSAEFSPDGWRVMTASDDRTVRVWDASSGATLTELKGHTKSLATAAFSPDGTRIVTASWDQTSRVWDAATGVSLAELKGHSDAVATAAFSPDGTRIVTASWDQTSRVWDAATGASLAELQGHSDALTSAAFSPDGTRIVTASAADGTVRLWDAATRTFTTSDDGTGRVWETALQLKGRVRPSNHLGGRNRVTSAAFSPDGTRIFTASADGFARVWDGATGASLYEPAGQRGQVFSAAFSPDGQRIVMASGDHTATSWALGSGHTARVVDAATGATLVELEGHAGRVFSVAFSPDGTRIVTASEDGTARVWDAATGANLAELRATRAIGAELGRHLDWVISAAFSSDGTRIVAVSRDGAVRVWNARTWTTEAELRGQRDWVISAAFSPDAARTVTASLSGAVRVWDTNRASHALLAAHRTRIMAAAFSPDGQRIVTASGDGMRSEDGTPRVWDALTGAGLAELKGHTGRVFSAAFSPDGARIVTASEDGTARVWDAATGANLAEIKAERDWMISAAFSPDGTRIVTASTDGTARIWDSVPYRIRHAERSANARGEDGSAIVKAWLDAVRTGREREFTVRLD